MQTWTTEIGTVSLSYGTLRVTGDAAQLYAWSHRTGVVWPCSYLDDYDRVSVTLDRDNGDLLHLVTLPDRYNPETGDELTAWVDDNLENTPFSSLRRGVDRIDDYSPENTEDISYKF